MGSKFFQDDRGNRSMMRLMSFLALWVAIAMTFLVLYYAHKPGGGFENIPLVIVGITLIWVAAAFFPKLLQKLVELWLGKIAGA
jgi:multisubunit Na+/H+ antiporter MnhB subunit